MLYYILPRSNPYLYKYIEVSINPSFERTNNIKSRKEKEEESKSIDEISKRSGVNVYFPEEEIIIVKGKCTWGGEAELFSFLPTFHDPIFLSHSIANRLHEMKLQISENAYQWDIYRKYTNPYEFIHTHIPFKKLSVSKYTPLSRSYFKMIEIIYKFDFDLFSACCNTHESRSGLPSISTPQRIFGNGNGTGIGNANIERRRKHDVSISSSSSFSSIKTFHLAEAPGGFIEACVSIRKKHCLPSIQSKDVYYAMSLREDTDENTPSWFKGVYFFKENPNVILENGADGTGNILSLENLQYMKKKYSSSMDFITADGGFDFSKDFAGQEIHMLSLLYGQVVYALTLQKKGGCFVLKVFDCFMEATLDILFLLTGMYEQVYICKPCTSRLANSEKYIVCKNFLFSSNYSFYPYLANAFSATVESYYSRKGISRFLKKQIHIPVSLFQRMEEINYMFGKEQIRNIEETLHLIHLVSIPEKPSRGCGDGGGGRFFPRLPPTHLRGDSFDWRRRDKKRKYGGEYDESSSSGEWDDFIKFEKEEYLQATENEHSGESPSLKLFPEKSSTNSFFDMEYLHNNGRSSSSIRAGTFEFEKHRDDSKEILGEYLKSNIYKCILWCIKHNIPVNKMYSVSLFRCAKY